MRPVNERPQWPTGIRPTPASITAWGEALIRQLVTVFQEFGYRLNHVLPKDGTEAMEGDLDMGGFAIVNTPSLGGDVAGPLSGMLAQRTGSDQSIVQYEFTKVVFNTKVYDDANAYNTSTGVYTVPATGIYLVSAFVHLSAISGDTVAVHVTKNGPAYLRVGDQLPGDGGLVQVGGTFSSKFTSGDTLTVEAFSTAANPSVTALGPLTYFSVQRLF